MVLLNVGLTVGRSWRFKLAMSNGWGFWGEAAWESETGDEGWLLRLVRRPGSDGLSWVLLSV